MERITKSEAAKKFEFDINTGVFKPVYNQFQNNRLEYIFNDSDSKKILRAVNCLRVLKYKYKSPFINYDNEYVATASSNYLRVMPESRMFDCSRSLFNRDKNNPIPEYIKIYDAKSQ